MKKIILPLALLALSLTTKAQIAKGSSMIGGDISFNQNNSRSSNFGSITTQENKYTSFKGQISYGYLLTNHFMIGIQAGYENYGSSEVYIFAQGRSSNIQKTQTVLPGIFARYYQRIGESRFYLYAQLSGAYALGNGTNTSKQNNQGSSQDNTTDMKSGGVEIKLIPGVVCMLTNKVGITAAVGNFGYSSNTATFSNKGKETSKTTTNNIYSNMSFSSISLGVNFYFGAKSGN